MLLIIFRTIEARGTNQLDRELAPLTASLYVHRAGDANSGLWAQSAGETPDNGRI